MTRSDHDGVGAMVGICRSLGGSGGSDTNTPSIGPVILLYVPPGLELIAALRCSQHWPFCNRGEYRLFIRISMRLTEVILCR